MRNFEKDPLRVAILGLIEGNYHPYSWSAIINGYDAALMALCPAPVIAAYLGRQPAGSVRIPLAKVTHIWTDVPADARRVAAATRISRIVNRPEDVIGEVEAVIISTDDGDDHVRRARPFVEAGLPIFVDKPLATNLEDLAQFCRWERAGARIVSSSGLRYAPELGALRGPSWRWLTGATCKSWRRYGIHVLEPLFALTGPGFVSVRMVERAGTELLELEHRSGTLVTLAAIEQGFGSAFVLHGYADELHRSVELRDTYAAFRAQLAGFLEYAAGERPVPHPFTDTVELMAIVIGGLLSKAEAGRRVAVSSILEKL